MRPCLVASGGRCDGADQEQPVDTNSGEALVPLAPRSWRPLGRSRWLRGKSSRPTDVAFRHHPPYLRAVDHRGFLLTFLAGVLAAPARR